MNIPVLNIWDETQQKYIGIPAITSGDTGGVSEEILEEVVNSALEDVSSQIQAHNNNSNAHSGIRAFINTALNTAKAYTDTEIAEFNESMKPLGYDYMPEGYPYIDPAGIKELIVDWSGTLVRDGTVTRAEILSWGRRDPNPLTEGETYVVTYNGVDYLCVCTKKRTNLILGNDLISTGHVPRPGEIPFYIYTSNISMSLCAQVEGSTTCTINKAIPVTVPMDEKFLPDSVKCANAPVVEELSESATVLVEDGGEVKRVAKDKVGGGSGGGGGSAALVITLQRGGAVEANMPFNEAHNSVLSGTSPMLINHQTGIPEIWCFKGGYFGDDYLSVKFGSPGANEKDIYYSASGSLYEQEEEG